MKYLSLKNAAITGGLVLGGSLGVGMARIWPSAAQQAAAKELYRMEEERNTCLHDAGLRNGTYNMEDGRLYVGGASDRNQSVLIYDRRTNKIFESHPPSATMPEQPEQEVPNRTPLEEATMAALRDCVP